MHIWRSYRPRVTGWELAMFVYVTSWWYTLHVCTYFGMLKRGNPYLCYGIKYTGGCCYKNGLIRQGLNPPFFTKIVFLLPLNAPDCEKSTLCTRCLDPDMYNISALTSQINIRYNEKLNNDPDQVIWKQESPEVSQRGEEKPGKALPKTNVNHLNNSTKQQTCRL